MVNTVKAAVSVFMLVLVLPAVTNLLQGKFGITGPSLDLRMLRGSIPFLATGCFLLGWAATPALFVIGKTPNRPNQSHDPV